MILKKIVLSDRGALLIDTILSETDWEISLLIVDDFGHHIKNTTRKIPE